MDRIFTPGPGPGATTFDADQFAALTNLMFAIRCGEATTPPDCGDILYRHSLPDVDDDSRMLARVIMAWFGLRVEARQPVHAPGSGCRYADKAGNCDFHDARHPNAILDEIATEMHAGTADYQSDGEG